MNAKDLAKQIANACLDKEGCVWDNVMTEEELDKLVTQPIIEFAAAAMAVASCAGRPPTTDEPREVLNPPGPRYL